MQEQHWVWDSVIYCLKPSLGGGLVNPNPVVQLDGHRHSSGRGFHTCSPCHLLVILIHLLTVICHGVWHTTRQSFCKDKTFPCHLNLYILNTDRLADWPNWEDQPVVVFRIDQINNQLKVMTKILDVLIFSVHLEYDKDQHNWYIRSGGYQN